MKRSLILFCLLLLTGYLLVASLNVPTLNVGLLKFRGFCRSCDLTNVNLEKKDLNGVDLYYANLTEANLTEANLGRVPIIILTADRPEYLVGTGANQTINQQNLFGIHVRYFFDVGLPEKDHKTLQKKIESAFNHSTGVEFKLPPGPVHLNFPFDEPLMPEKIEAIISPSIAIKNMEKAKINFSIPKLEMAKTPIIIVGPMGENTHQKELVQFGEKIQAPILADPLSQLRFGTENEIVLSNYDYFLRYKKINPDLIIRFGRKPTSKVLNQLLHKWKNKTILFF